jgi:hypothetical protein
VSAAPENSSWFCVFFFCSTVRNPERAALRGPDGAGRTAMVNALIEKTISIDNDRKTLEFGENAILGSGSRAKRGQLPSGLKAQANPIHGTL